MRAAIPHTMAWNTKRLLGLDMGTSAVKAVELTAQQGKPLRVTGMAWMPLPNPGEVQATVKEVLRRGAFHTRLTASNVFGRLVSIKYVALPPMTEEETKKALYFEADKYIPFEVKDAFLDGQQIGTPAPGAKEVTAVLVAARRNLVLERADCLSRSGLLPAIMDVDAFAIGNAFELGLAAEGPSDRSVAVVDIGAAKTNITILRGGSTRFSREIYLAGNDVTDAIAKRLSISAAEAEAVKISPAGQEDACREAAADVIEDLANEIRLSFEFYENQHETMVEEVCLSGGGARFVGLVESLAKVFNKPVRLWNPFQNLAGEGPGLDPGSLGKAGGTMAVALGLASRLGTL